MVDAADAVAMTSGSFVRPEVLNADTPCRKCGYNLRGLSQSIHCPECGLPVGMSATGTLLCFAEPRWLRTVARGARMIRWGVAIWVLTMILGLITTIAIGPSLVWLTQLGVLAAQVVILLGIWRLTTPDPSGLGETDYGTSRKMIRAGVVFSISSTAVEVTVNLGMPPPILLMPLQAVGAIVRIVVVIAYVAQFIYLEKLSDRLPEPALSRLARRMAWGVGIAYGGIVLIGGTFVAVTVATGRGPTGGALVTGLGCATGLLALALFILLFVYLSLLRQIAERIAQEARIAEAMWARATQAPAAAV